MSKWEFKTIQPGSGGGVELAELSSVQKARINKYIEALEAAARSVVANPPFSHYFVKESISSLNGEVVSAGNIEYGFCQALHGEESAVAAFRSRYGRNDSDPGEVILGIVAGNPGNIATPCGNCRDIMLEDLGENFEIISGAADGGVAVVANMSHYLFSDFKSLAIEDISKAVFGGMTLAIRQGERLVNDAYSPKAVHPERRYHALIITRKNNFVGARDTMWDYHSIYALRDAIRQARRANDPFVQSVVIVCEGFGGGPPHVMYKDRQHLMELNLQAELLMGKEMDPPVYLATYQKQDRITGVWKTSVKGWIPFVFTPRNLGEEFIAHLAAYFRSK